MSRKTGWLKWKINPDSYRDSRNNIFTMQFLFGSGNLHVLLTTNLKFYK